MPSITSLLTATALSGTEPLPVDQSGATVKATVNQVKTYVNTTPAITGGSINSTPIGATTPSTGAFTSLTASGAISQSSIGVVEQIKLSSSGGYIGFYKDDATTRTVVIQNDTVNFRLTTMVSGTTTHIVSFVGASQITDISASGLAVTGNISSSGRTLVGTTTDDGVNALQVNGTAKTTGIKFANTGGTKQALDYYEEGTWTPIDGSGAGLTFIIQSATYTRIGRQVTVVAYFSFPATASAATAIIGGLPFAVGASQYQPVNIAASVASVGGMINAVSTTITLTSAPGTYGVLKTNAGLSGNGITLAATYFI